MKRPSELYIAVLLGVIATLGRVYFPTEPMGAGGLRVLFGLYAAVFLVRSLTAGPVAPRSLLVKIGMGLGLLPLIVLLGLISGYGFTLAYIFFRTTLFIALFSAVAAIGFGFWRVRQGRLSGTALQVLVASIVFVNATVFGPLCMWMWAKPDLDACHRVAEHPAIQVLTPERYIEDRSFPYEIIYIPSAHRVAGAFKMGGNLAIGPWDIQAGNRLAVVDVSDPDAPVLGELQLEGDPLPQYMTVGPSEDQMIVNRLGYHRHLLDHVDLSDFPTLRLAQRIETTPQPHSMQRLDDGRLLLATMRREVMLLDYETGEIQASQPIHTWLATPGLTLTDLAVSPDGRIAYLSMFGTDIILVDLTDQRLSMRSVGVGFGAGQLIHDPLLPRLYRTDFFQNTFRVLESETLKVLSEVPLDYTPRPVAVAPERDLLAIGAWIEGDVHFMRRSDGEPLDVSIPVGPYLRKLAIDGERGLLFAGTKCGIVMADLEAFGL